jgi:HlyD family secretion protein
MRKHVPRGIIISSSIVVIAGLSIFFILQSGNDKLVLSGTVESTEISVISEVTGKITDMRILEGDLLEQGDIVCKVDSDTQKLAVERQEALVDIRQARLDNLIEGSRLEEIVSAEAAYNAAKSDYEYWKDREWRMRSLFNAGNISETDFLDIKHNLDTAEQAMVQALSRWELLKQGADTQEILGARSELQAEEVSLAQSRLQLEKYSIKTPISGTCLYLTVDKGDIVNPGTVAGVVSNLKDLWINVYIPEKYLGEVYLGEKIKLVPYFYKDREFTGEIVYISSKAEYTPKNIQTNEARENTVFKVKVRIEDTGTFLKPGMTADVLIPFRTKGSK